jgi:prophage regulatory protein
MASEDLVGFAEIIGLVGRAKRTTRRYTSTPDFPEPAATLAAGHIWRRADVEAWAKASLPLPEGHPRKASGGYE